MTDRRAFIAGMIAAGVAPQASWAELGSPVFLSAAQTPEGAHLLCGLDAAGEITFTLPIPARGHAAAAHPTRPEAIAFARRPGSFAIVLDCQTGRQIAHLQTQPGCHFYGHGAFSEAGDLLFTTENDVDHARGVIGIWDTAHGYRRIGAFSSAGIGPHEIIRLPTGDLAVANGGILTHPDTGREKLNLDTMRPNLAILSPDGQLRARVDVPREQHHNSLRHIAARGDGAVICGFQWQGDLYDPPPLLAIWREGVLAPVEVDAATTRGLNGYIGSVCVTGDGGFAATSPRGARAILLDSSGRQVAAPQAADICGICQTRTGALASDGLGWIYALSERGLTPLCRHNLAFDNHLVPIA